MFPFGSSFSSKRPLHERRLAPRDEDPFWLDLPLSVRKGGQLSQSAPSPNAPFSFRVKRPNLSFSYLHNAARSCQEDLKELGGLLGRRLTSPEFWVGAGMGAFVRLSSKIAILLSFPDRPATAAAVAFFACAAGGLLAGLATHFARLFYRRARAPHDFPLETFDVNDMLNAALIGLFGGLFGGVFATTGAVAFTETTGFAVGAGTGAVLGVVRTTQSAPQQARPMVWSRALFRSALYALIGGATGAALSNVLAPHASIAAPSAPPATGFVPPSMPSSVPDVIPVPSSPAPIGYNLSPEVLAPRYAPVQNVALDLRVTGPTPPSAASAQECCKPCPIQRVVHHPAPKLRHVRHVLKHTPHRWITPVERNVVVDAPKTLQPPPTVTVEVRPPPQELPPAPKPKGLCDSETCSPVCDEPPPPRISQLDIKGPCADPNAACVEKIVYNEDDIATKVVLEPTKSLRKDVLATRTGPDGEHLAILVPLTRHVLAPFAPPVPV